jgi:hypothetical protein
MLSGQLRINMIICLGTEGCETLFTALSHGMQGADQHPDDVADALLEVHFPSPSRHFSMHDANHEVHINGHYHTAYICYHFFWRVHPLVASMIATLINVGCMHEDPDLSQSLHTDANAQCVLHLCAIRVSSISIYGSKVVCLLQQHDWVGVALSFLVVPSRSPSLHSLHMITGSFKNYFGRSAESWGYTSTKDLSYGLCGPQEL